MITRQNLDRSRVAVFSPCELYRYSLLIRWDDSKPLMASIGVNPSTANEFHNDPTVYRDIKRADFAGFGAVLKLNLFAYRATDPREMRSQIDPYGAWRDAEAIVECAREHNAAMIVATWGENGRHLNRSAEMQATAQRADLSLYSYQVNKSGEPIHPLYLPIRITPSVWIAGKVAA